MATGEIHLFDPFSGFHLRHEVLKQFQHVKKHNSNLYQATRKVLRVAIPSLPVDHEFGRRPSFSLNIARRILDFLEFDPIGAEIAEDRQHLIDFREVAQALLEEFEERICLKAIKLSSGERTWAYRLMVMNLYVKCCHVLRQFGRIRENDLRSNWIPGLILIQEYEQSGVGAVRVTGFRRMLEYGYNAPGAAILVVQGGSVLDQRTYGMANIEHEWPITPQTVFDLASISKAFTAFCILRLEQDGLLDLNQPLGTVVPELAHLHRDITVKNLVYHTSGLPEYFTILRERGRHYAGLRNEDIIEVLRKFGELDFLPGQGARYSNSNYMLLAEIVSRISGQPFEVYIREQILRPLTLNSTYVYKGAEEAERANLATGYDRVGPHFTPVPPGSLTTGGGNIRSSLRDMALWFSALLGGRFVNSGTYKRIFSPGRLSSGQEIPYGFGWFLGERNGMRYAFHTGYDNCVGMTVLIPERRLAMVLLSNDRSRENIRRLIGRAVIQAWIEEGAELGGLEEI